MNDATVPAVPPVQAPAASKAPGNKLRIGAALLIAAALCGGLYLAFDEGVAETTQDAYVDGNIVQLTPQQGGSVTMIAADNTDLVSAGQLLVQFNDIDTRLAVERAQAQLARTVRQVRVQFANLGQSSANVALRASDLAKAEADLARRARLGASGAVSGEDIVHAEDAVKAARSAFSVAQQQQLSAAALVDQTSIASHPDVQAASAQLRDAYLAQARTSLRAPVSGIVGKRNVQLGQRVAAGAPLMSIVPAEQMWVNANFKESQLRHLRIGQPVLLFADVYGKSVRYHGRIEGQDAATGSAFSLLPAQNASGNWIKVVQRVPVRVALDPAELAAHPLKLGLSMHAEVDTGDQRGAVASVKAGVRPAWHTDVFSRELADADANVKAIIAANSGAGGANGASTSIARVK